MSTLWGCLKARLNEELNWNTLTPELEAVK